MSKIAKKFSFLTGTGSVLDIMPGTDYQSMIDSRSDSEKLSDDWVMLGAYIRRAQERYSEQGSEKQPRGNGARA